MASLPIEDREEWLTTIVRIAEGIEHACPEQERGALLAHCRDIRDRGLASGAFDEDEYVSFAHRVIASASPAAAGDQLALDLTRVHCDVAEVLRQSARVGRLAALALQRPDDVTPANRVFVSDLLYNGLLNIAEEALDTRGVAGVIEVLENRPFLKTGPGVFIRRSVIRRLAPVAVRHDPSAVDVLAQAFADDEGILRDLAKLKRSQRSPDPG